MGVLEERGAIFLGSRLKRLGERLQTGAAKVISGAGLPVQPTHMPLLTALDSGPLTVGQLVQAVGISQPGVTQGLAQLVKLGLVEVRSGVDQRVRYQQLTDAGAAVMARAKTLVWPRLEAAVQELCEEESADLLRRLAALELTLQETPLEELAAGSAPAAIRLKEFSSETSSCFKEINSEWIDEMFVAEAGDLATLNDPQGAIIDNGGVILFAEVENLGVVGTCALRRAREGVYELTKMGVKKVARGLGVGKFLLHSAIERARAMQAARMFLLTSNKSETAIRLYETAGFTHSREIMQDYGSLYKRCDVAMVLELSSSVDATV